MSALALAIIYFFHIKVQFFGLKGLPEAYVATFVLYILSHLFTAKTDWGEKLEEFFASLLVPISIPGILILALSSSIGEELLFRGVLQNLVGLIPSSIIFGLVHVPMNKVMIPWTLIAMMMGFALGGLYIYSGNLLAPVLFHFLINVLNIWTINQKYGYQNPLP